MGDKRKERMGMLCIFGCALMWSISGVLIKSVPWHATAIAGWRSLLAAGVMGLYIRAERLPVRVSRMSLISACAMAGMFLCFTLANKLTTSANAIVIQSGAPAFILLYNVVFGKAKPRGIDVTTVALTLLGIVLFFLDQLTPGRLMGNGVALVAGVLAAVTYVINCRADTPTCLSAILMAHLLTAAVGIPVSFLTDTPVTGQAVLFVALLGIVQLGLPYILYGMAVRTCPPLACSLIGMTETVCNPIWVFLFSREAPSLQALIGGALVLLSIAGWAVFSQRKGAEG